MQEYQMGDYILPTPTTTIPSSYFPAYIPVKKWEYYVLLKHLSYFDVTTLNELGEKGWELVAVNDKELVFKREKKYPLNQI